MKRFAEIPAEEAESKKPRTGQIDNEGMRKVADWLSSLNFHAVHKDNYEKVTLGTGSWIFEHPAYLKWISQESGTLWGTGMPGAGKTCLASIVVNHLMELPTSTVIYVYCQYKEELTTPQLLASLLKQLVEASGEAARYVELNLYASCMRTNTNPTKSELQKTLANVVSLFPKVFVVIDALDELEERVRQELVGSLIPFRLSLFMTSRPLVLSHLSAPDFEIRAPSIDFKAFIASQIDTLPKLKMFLDTEMSAAMIDKIERKSEGMFLLAALQLASLATKGATNLLSLESTVDQLPATLDEMYELTLHRIQRQSQEEQALACHALLCVVYAARFLKVDELLEFLAVDLVSVTFDKRRRTNEKVLLSVCLGLLTIEKESGTVHLIHYTAQKFLEVQNILPFTNPHTFISNISAIYLSLSNHIFTSITSSDDLEKVENSHPFFSYAIRTLGYHTRLAVSSPKYELPEHVSQLFNHHSPILLLPMVGGKEYLDYGNIIHFTALYGLTSAFEENIQSPIQLPGVQSSPLFYACLGGNIKIVQDLLDRQQTGTIPNTGAAFGASPLHVAAENGYATIVDQLLNASKAAEAIASSSHGLNYPDSPGDLATVINAKLPDIVGETALFLACQNSHDEVVRQLLNCQSVNPNASTKQGWSPLHIASVFGYTSVVQLLLNTPGVDVNAREEDGWTALHLASQNGHEQVVKLLLSVPEIDINAREMNRATPLFIASENGHGPVVRVLLSAPGIDVEAQDGEGATPLFIASQEGYEPVVQLLLRAPGVDVNKGDNTGTTALKTASERGHDPVVRVLLSVPGVDVNAKDRDGWTPLYIASEIGHDIVVRTLLSQPGIDVRIRTEQAVDGCPSGETALQAARRTGRNNVVAVFKDMGFEDTD